ncbi:MAG: ABC transporter permease [Eubacteriales bacterium]|nr:ABC transporter permease [Eubacteriales bacterium]
MENEKKKQNKNMKLDDAARVQVLSPGMMVAKRFLRNRLAIIGLVVIVCMFVFSFLGGALIPYSQSEVFYRTESVKKDYAGATKIKDYLVMMKEGEQLPKDGYSKSVLAITTGKYNFMTADKKMMCLQDMGANVYLLYNGKKPIERNEIGMICQNSFTPYAPDMELSYEFCRNIMTAICEGKSVTEDGSYTIEQVSDSASMVKDKDGVNYAYVSDMNINAVASGEFLSPEYKEAVVNAIESGATDFTYVNADGTEEEYMISSKGGQYEIKRYQDSQVIDTYAAPSSRHLVGTDANGMDLLARLMYGGRISLLIGFVVVFLEVLIGVIIGGISGFFGGWVDNLLMRLVDVIYCIPSIPLYMILGSIMDYMQVSATVRIYMLCVIMGIIGWVSIARIVRGQILSLREQEFMIAAEATGISIRRRIFKHLIPNVIPQLIVFATMGLGDVILAEASLSFLGLGIKYPAASWGSIINAVNDSYVMTNYLFVWIPAGFLILLTVLAFNFVGDGLRDAFDPKMKR